MRVIRKNSSDPKYSIIIPVYNGERSVKELTLRIKKVFESLSHTFEIIYIDDCSQDNSWAELRALAKGDQRVKILRLKRNFGQHNATLCGMAYSTGDYVITMDDDLQHKPEDIPKLMARLDQTKAKVVIAKLLKKKHSWHRQIASGMMRILNEVVINKPKGIYLSSFRLLDRQVVRSMLKLKSSQPYLPTLIFSVTSEVVNEDVLHSEREHGTSNYNLFKMLKLASFLIVNKAQLKGFIKGSKKPVYLVESNENINF